MLDPQSADQLQDRQLLQRFAAEQDEQAFAALVRRHGPLVLGVCRRRLRDSHEAEDVFQATFLVLARRAGSICKQDSVGSWLYGVASRLAGKVNAHAARRRLCEQRATTMTPPDPPAEMSWREVCALLDEELNRLPAKYRDPLVACYLEGQTQAEAAQQLGWPRGTLKRRLERARVLLRQRLDQRGVALSAAFGILLLAQKATAAPPDALVTQTAQAATAFAALQATTGGTLSRAVQLAESLLRGRFLSTRQLLLVGALVGGLLATSAGIVSHQALAARQPGTEQQLQPPAAGQDEESSPRSGPPVYTDRYDDPLPYRLIACS